MKDCLAIDIDVELYAVDTVNRAAYWFTDTCDVKLEQVSARQLRVLMWPRSPVPVEQLERQFHTALLEERLRRIVDAETGEIRRRVWSAALREALPRR